ncbi:hypothetical protein FRB91_006443 [Serendipita sp. 411]|nr:hypothetical protein FRB91_006443 [Serendipita sp. 411]
MLKGRHSEGLSPSQSSLPQNLYPGVLSKMRFSSLSLMSFVLLTATDITNAWVTTCQTTSTACTLATAQEAIANLKISLDYFGAQPAGASFYLFTGTLSGNDNFATCAATLQSDAYHPATVQANITKATFDSAITSMINKCVLAGKRGNLAFDDITRFEGPTLYFR